MLLETKGCVWLAQSANLTEERVRSVKFKVKVYSKDLATEYRVQTRLYFI